MRAYDYDDEVKKMIKGTKWLYVLSSILLIACGLVFFFYPQLTQEIICTACGILMLVFGCSKLIGYFGNARYFLAFQFDLSLGIFTLLFGLLLLLHPGAVLSFVWILIGLYEIVEGAFKVQTSLEARRFGLPRWWLLFLSALLCIAFGAFLTFNPAKGGTLFFQVLALSLVCVGLENLLFTFCAAGRIRQLKKALEDEWIDPEDIID